MNYEIKKQFTERSKIHLSRLIAFSPYNDDNQKSTYIQTKKNIQPADTK